MAVPHGQELQDAQYTQSIIFQTCSNIWWESSKSSFFISRRLAISQIVNCYTPHALLARFWPQSCLLKASHSWSHLSLPYDPLWTSCDTQKYVCITLCYLYTLAEVFQVLVMEFSPTEVYLFHSAHNWTTWQRGSINKSMWLREQLYTRKISC